MGLIPDILTGTQSLKLLPAEADARQYARPESFILVASRVIRSRWQMIGVPGFAAGICAGDAIIQAAGFDDSEFSNGIFVG